LADLLYTSLEVEADREWNHKAIAESESRYAAYKNGEMGSVDALAAIEVLRNKFVK
jgi:tRNA(Ile2) C34 agmatinyltransferase TiaS